jgi:hypothetical protein
VIVTHQKRTMDAADILYGVTMAGDGVTKVVSRRLPREVEADSGSAEGPPPFAGIAEDGSDEGFTAPAAAANEKRRGDVEAA